MDLQHLHPDTATLLTLPEKDRIYRTMEDGWFPTGQSERVFEAINRVVAQPVGAAPAHLVLSMGFANGKSAMLRQYQAQLNKPFEQAPIIHTPALYFPGPQMELSSSSLYYTLAESLDVSQLLGLYEGLDQVLAILQHRRVRLLLLDDMDYFIGRLTDRHANVWQHVLQWCQATNTHMVIGANYPAANRLLALRGLAAEFEKVTIPLWELNADFNRVLEEFEKRLPLQFPSHLTTPPTAAKLHSLSGGRLAKLADILKEAAVYAIRTRKERITPNLLHELDFRTAADHPEGSFG